MTLGARVKLGHKVQRERECDRVTVTQHFVPELSFFLSHVCVLCIFHNTLRLGNEYGVFKPVSG